jgi:hypothetical protein
MCNRGLLMDTLFIAYEKFMSTRYAFSVKGLPTYILHMGMIGAVRIIVILREEKLTSY